MTDDDFAEMRIKNILWIFFYPMPLVAQTQPLGICGMT